MNAQAQQYQTSPVAAPPCTAACRVLTAAILAAHSAGYVAVLLLAVAYFAGWIG